MTLLQFCIKDCRLGAGIRQGQVAVPKPHISVVVSFEVILENQLIDLGTTHGIARELQPENNDGYAQQTETFYVRSGKVLTL